MGLGVSTGSQRSEFYLEIGQSNRLRPHVTKLENGQSDLIDSSFVFAEKFFMSPINSITRSSRDGASYSHLKLLSVPRNHNMFDRL